MTKPKHDQVALAFYRQKLAEVKHARGLNRHRPGHSEQERDADVYFSQYEEALTTVINLETALADVAAGRIDEAGK
jgi:hypothetical protein